MNILPFIGLAVILVLASEGMGVAGGNIVIVLALFGRLFPRLTAVQAQVHYLNGNLPAVAAVNGLLVTAKPKRSDKIGLAGRCRSNLPSTLIIRDLKVRLGERESSIGST